MEDGQQDDQNVNNPGQDPSDGSNAEHPAWADVLDGLPDEIQGILKPRLADWDQKVQGRINTIHEQYNPYKPLIENQVDIDAVQQALFLRHQLETNPADLVQKAIEHFNLEQFKAQVASQEDEDEDGYEYDEDNPYGDLANHPQFKQFLEKQNEIEQRLEADRQAQEMAQAQAAFEQYMTELHSKYDESGGFDDDYVTSLIAQGMDGEAAVQQFQQRLASYAQRLNSTQQPPKQQAVIAGSGGTTGSGIPDQPVDFGKMKTGELNELVAQYIQQANTPQT